MLSENTEKVISEFESLVRNATKDVALSIEESGGTPVYTYRGVGEVDSSSSI